jgi:hypothetical protein
MHWAYEYTHSHTYPSLSVVRVEGHRTLVALGRSLIVSAAGVVVAEEAEGDAIVGVQLGRREKMLRSCRAELPRLFLVTLLLCLGAVP